MSSRITMRDLEGLVNRLNLITASPDTPWTRGDSGKLKGNIGNYHLDGAYGGWTLHRMQNESGGVTDPLRIGYVSKRELYQALHAYIAGIEESKS